MAALASNLGRLTGALAIGTAVVTSFSRLTTAGGMSTFFILSHNPSRRLDAILHGNSLIFSAWQLGESRSKAVYEVRQNPRLDTEIPK